MGIQIRIGLIGIKYGGQKKDVYKPHTPLPYPPQNPD